MSFEQVCVGNDQHRIFLPTYMRDTLTINNHSISTFKNNLQDFKFT